MDAVQKILKDAGLADDKVSAIMDEVAQAVEAGASEAAKLTAKNKQLIGELRKAREGSTVDVSAYEEKIATLEASHDDWKKKYEAGEKTWTKKTQELSGKYEAERAAVYKHKVDTGLMEGLLKVKCDQGLLAGAKALLRGKVTVKEDGEDRIAMVGDKPLDAYLAEWAATDEAKPYIAGTGSSGGGALGSGQKRVNVGIDVAIAEAEKAGDKVAVARLQLEKLRGPR